MICNNQFLNLSLLSKSEGRIDLKNGEFTEGKTESNLS